MGLMKLAGLIAVISFLGTAGLAQGPCNLSLNNPPVVFGLKLGMPFEQVQAVLGKDLKMKPKKTGEGSFFHNFIEKPAPSNLSGVRALFLRFLHNKVYQIEIFYEDEDKTTKLKDFLNRLSADLDLPAAAWKSKNGKAEMNCGDFLLTADNFLNSHIELTDDAAYTEFKAKQERQKISKNKKNKKKEKKQK
jgi:hypothetical protein